MTFRPSLRKLAAAASQAWGLRAGGYESRYLKLALAGVAAGALAAPSLASSCSVNDISPAAIACSGGYAGNVLDNNAGDVATQQAALAALGFTWDGAHFGDFEKLSSLNGATTIDFESLLHGITYVGLHVGGPGGGQTTFYKFDGGAALDAFSIHLGRSSGAVLYATEEAASPAPEPVSWAMMLGGFGAIGSVMRSRRRPAVSFG